MTYKVGDIVVVRSDLGARDKYYNFDHSDWNVVTEEMMELRGCSVTISEVWGQYNIAEDHGQFGWTDEMFSGLLEDIEGAEFDTMDDSDLEYFLYN